MIKVINVSSDSNIGGAGRCILTFLRNYDRTQFDVKVIVPKGSALIPYIEQTNTSYIEADGIADTSFSKEGTESIKAILAKEKPDLVHSHASFSARLAAKALRIPVIYTRHSVFPNPENITKGFGKLKNGLINNLTASRIIAVAQAASDNLTEAGVSAKKITVIPNGVDPIRLYDTEELQKAKSFYGLSDENFVFAMVARVEDIKGHDYFIDAANIVLEKHPEARFFICGTGNYVTHVKNKIENMKLDEKVLYLGHVQDVTSIMNVIDVNVNASFGTEATSLSLLEGMSVGTPIIASDYGGNPELVRPGINGLLFESKNAQQLAEKMCSLIEDEELLSQLKDGALKLYKKEYTSAVMTSRIEDVYKKTARRK